MERFQRASRRLQGVILVCVILTPAAVVLNAVTGAWSELLRLPPGIGLEAGRITGGRLSAVLAIGSITPAAYLVAFWRLYRLLGLFRQGEVFTFATVAAIRRIGWALAAIDIAAMAQTLVTGPVLTVLRLSPGHVSVRLEVGFLIVGLFVVLVGHVMELGRRLQEEERLVI